jgi:hypothetical protein
MNLVNYFSSDEDDGDTPAPPPPQKKRKLPRLSSSLSLSVPVDDPAKHQGRVRTTPFVEGQWAAYVYVPIRLDELPHLRKLLSDTIRMARAKVPALHPLGTTADGEKAAELHISISRVLYIRKHQHDELKRAVKALAQSCPPYVLFHLVKADANVPR